MLPDALQSSKKLRFGFVHVHEFQVAMGDSPFVSSGPPVRLGRKTLELQLTVDQYETLRRFRPRRNVEQLRMPERRRVISLGEVGYTRKAIKKATDDATEAKRLILESIRQRGSDKSAERSESIRSVLLAMLRGRNGQRMLTVPPKSVLTVASA